MRVMPERLSIGPIKAYVREGPETGAQATDDTHRYR